MRRPATAELLVALLATAGAGSVGAQEPRPLAPADVEALADRHFGPAPEAGGAAVIIVVRDGQVVFSKGYGLAHPKTGEPVDPAKTLFRIGSITKVFTAIAALQLIEQGGIDPAADVNRYLEKIGVRIADRFSEPVKMADLLTLQAGRFDWTYSYYYPIHDDENSKLAPDEIGRRLWRSDRPGDVPAYDNNGVGLIGLISEAAAGRSYRELVRTGILEPLGMTKSVSGVPRNRVPEMVGCSDPDPSTAFRSCPYDDITENLRPSGGMTVTAEDMGRLMIAILDGGRAGDRALLSSAGWSRFIDFDQTRMDPRLPAWGQVIYESFAGGRYAYGHDGGIGRFASTLRLYPAVRVGVFTSLQSGLDWERPSKSPASLSDVLRRPAPPSPAMVKLSASRAGFEAAFAREFIAAGGPPSAETAPPPPLIPIEKLGGRYWVQLAKGKRPLVLRMLERTEPTTDVLVTGPDRLRVVSPAGPHEYGRTGVNAFRQEGGEKTLVFAASPRGINANWTDATALGFLRRLPWHYRPSVSVYPLPIALAVLLIAGVVLLLGRSDPTARRAGIATTVGTLLVAVGLLAELQLAVSQWYHGGHLWLAVAWRLVLHLGVAALVLIPIYGLRDIPRDRPVARISGVIASVAAATTVILVGYWGLLGQFTG